MANCPLTLDKNIVFFFHNFPVKQTQNKALEGSLISKSPKNNSFNDWMKSLPSLESKNKQKPKLGGKRDFFEKLVRALFGDFPKRKADAKVAANA